MASESANINNDAPKGDAGSGQKGDDLAAAAQKGTPGPAAKSPPKTKTYRVRCSHCDAEIAHGKTAEEAAQLLEVHRANCPALHKDGADGSDDEEEKHTEQIVKYVGSAILFAVGFLLAVKGIMQYRKWQEERRASMKELSDKSKEALK